MLARESRAVGLAFWESRDVAEGHDLARTEFRGRMLSIAGVRIEDVVDYELVVARLGPGLSEAS